MYHYYTVVITLSLQYNIMSIKYRYIIIKLPTDYLYTIDTLLTNYRLNITEVL